MLCILWLHGKLKKSLFSKLYILYSFFYFYVIYSRNLIIFNHNFSEVKFCTLLKMQSFSPPDVTSSTEMLEEEFVCGVCCDLMVIPTTLNCGHSFCRHCLARWFDVGKKTECPICRKVCTHCCYTICYTVGDQRSVFSYWNIYSFVFCFSPTLFYCFY